MRQIKFRLVLNNKIVGYERLSKFGWEWMVLNLNPKNKEIWTKGIITIDSEKLIRDQYIGINDKNNEEIYDNDIIELDEIRIVISWNDGAFQMITNANQGDSPVRKSRLKYFKKIGNIHENSELLN